MDKNTDQNTDKRLKNLKAPWKKGDPSPNPEGHPKGQRNYATIYKEAMEILAKKNATTVEKLEAEIVANGMIAARKGDFRFYKDNLDRLHGTAVQKSENNLNVVVPVLVKFLRGKNEPRDSN
jgi:hypothetical protein